MRTLHPHCVETIGDHSTLRRAVMLYKAMTLHSATPSSTGGTRQERLSLPYPLTRLYSNWTSDRLLAFEKCDFALRCKARLYAYTDPFILQNVSF